MLKFEGVDTLSHTYLDKRTKTGIHVGIDWATFKVIFNHTGSPRMKISQEVLGGGRLLFISHCI